MDDDNNAQSDVIKSQCIYRALILSEDKQHRRIRKLI